MCCIVKKCWTGAPCGFPTDSERTCFAVQGLLLCFLVVEDPWGWKYSLVWMDRGFVVCRLVHDSIVYTVLEDFTFYSSAQADSGRRIWYWVFFQILSPRAVFG